MKQAHGCHGDAGLEQPHWVSSVAALQNSDTVASGASGCESRPYGYLQGAAVTPLGCHIWNTFIGGVDFFIILFARLLRRFSQLTGERVEMRPALSWARAFV